MQAQIEGFIRALRAAEVRVSVAEAMEAHEVVARIGYADRTLLKDALGLTLAKTVPEKARFAESFDSYFARDQFTGPAGGATGARPRTGNDLADMLLADDREGLAAAMEGAGRAAGASDVRFRTQVNFLARRLADAMGLAELERLIAAVARGEVACSSALAEDLEAGRRRLLDEARAYLERQFDLYGRFAGEQLRESFLERTPLAAVDRRDFQRMNRLVRRMARRLAARHMARHKRARRGHLDVRRTLRASMAHDGIPFEVHWKQKRIERPKIVAVCDVSRSVAAAAQFLLMFLYNLNDLLSGVRSFAFSSHLIEIADILDDHDVEGVIPKVLEKIGFLSTDYGRSLAGLKDDFGDAIDRRTTVIVLGDARSNNTAPRADVMKWLNQRSRRVIWLNPEPETFWGTGDSEMPRYRPFCHVAKTCRTVKDLERVVDNLLRVTARF
ncbi:MAG: VWA domain-containing protein [Rhodospirillaceae bacterium]